jgi:hypothetical protein
MLDECGARGLSGARDDVDDAGRQTGVSEARRELEHGKGVCSAGLRTVVQPAQIAGASFQPPSSAGSSTE